MQTTPVSAQPVGGAASSSPAGPANIFEFCSPDFGEFAKAFAPAQAHIKRALKDNTNPHFGSNYADLASIQEACMEALTSGGFSIVQPLIYHPEMKRTFLVTRLLHTSGQWMQSSVPIDDAKGAQAFGSFVTYMRRYSLAAIVGVASDDDDGNAATAAHEARDGQRPRRDGRWPAPGQAADGSSKPPADAQAKTPTADEYFEWNKKQIDAATTAQAIRDFKGKGARVMSQQQLAEIVRYRAERLAELTAAEQGSAASEGSQLPAEQPAAKPAAPAEPKARAQSEEALYQKASALYQRLASTDKGEAQRIWEEVKDNQLRIDEFHTVLMRVDSVYQSRHAPTMAEAKVHSHHPDWDPSEQ